MGQLGDLADLLLQSVSEVPPLHFYQVPFVICLVTLFLASSSHLQSSTLAKHCTKLLKYNEYAYNDKPGEVKYIDQSLFDRAFGASQNAIHSAAGLRETQPMGNLPTANPKYVDDLFKQAQESVQKLYEALYPGGYCTKAQKTRDKFTEEMGDARQCDERRAQRLKIMISIQQSKASKGKALTDEWEKATVDVKLSVVDVTVPTSRPILEHEDSRTTARKYHQTMPLHGLVHMLVQERGLSLEYFLTFYLRCEGQQDLTKDGVIFKRLAKEQKLKTAAKEIPIEEPMVKQTALLLPTLELFLVVLEPKEDFIVITHGHDKSLAGKEPDVGYIVKKSNAAHALGKPGTIYRKPKDKKPIHYESLQWDHLHNTGKEYYISPIRQPQVTPFSYIFPAWDSSQGTSDSSQPRASIQNLMTAGSEPYPDPNNTTISAGPKIPCTELPSTFSPIGSGAHDIPRPTLSQRTPVAVSQSISMSLSVTAVTHNEDNTSNSGLITRVGSEGEISFAERPLPLLPNLPARPLSSIFLSDSPETPVQKSSQLAQGLQTSVVPQSSPGRPVLHIQPTRNPIAWTPTLPNPESETGGEEEYWTPIVETPLKPYAISLRDDIGASHSGDQVVHTTGAGSVTSPTALPTPNDSELGSPIPLILNTPRPEAKNDYSGTRPQRALNDTQSPGLVKAADIPIKGSPVPASASTLSDAKTSRLSSSASVKALPALPQANYTTPSASTSGTIAAPKPRRSAVTTNQPSTAVKPSTKQVMPPAPDSSEIGSSVSQTPTTADPAFRHGVFKASHRHQPEYTQRSSASLPLGSSRSSGGEASVSATLAPTGSSAQSLADMSHWNANTLVTAYPTPTIKSSSFKSAATLATSVGKVVTEPTHPSRPADEKTLGARVDGLHDKTMYSISNDHELVSSDPHPPVSVRLGAMYHDDADLQTRLDMKRPNQKPLIVD
ncbi:hypothetical protein FRB96_005136 [Tulasnella sp. 330]|nr:hypothetical protein FRB96_005136 [Tulasnella sp. 330]